MPRIYTKTGDQGLTGLYDGTRLSKTEPIFDLLGTLDELSSHIGMLILCCDKKPLLREIQQTLLNVGSIVATPNPTSKTVLPDISGIVERIENEIDQMEQTLPELKVFLLVGGDNSAESCAHVCRTVARRAEREFLKSGVDNDTIRIWLNRLSDYFFTLARVLKNFF